MTGYIYNLTNPSVQQHMKIGYATNVKQWLPCCRAEASMCYNHVPDCCGISAGKMEGGVY